MRILLAGVLVAFLLPANAETPPIACDTYDVAFCFPKGRDTVVSQRWSDGFEVYDVTKRGALLISIQRGTTVRSHPRRISLKHHQKNDFDIDIGFVEDVPGDKRVDILVGYPDGQTLHVSTTGAEGRQLLAYVMSNFRPCRRQWFAGVECDATPLFNPADERLVRSIK